MAHFGFKKKRPYYQLENILFFFDPKIINDDITVYPGIPSGNFIYLVIDWGKIEVREPKEAFTFTPTKPLEPHYRLIIGEGIGNVERIDIVIRYPEYIDIFINDSDYAFDYAHRGRLELPGDTEYIHLLDDKSII